MTKRFPCLLAAGTAALAALALLPSPLLALDPARAVTQYVGQVWQSEQGLPVNAVEALAQTPDGYLWVGTQEGLARFDGVRFTVYDKRNTEALRHNMLRALAADRQGRLWIGTADGLARVQHGVFTALGPSDGLVNPAVTALAVDSDGTVWVGTRGGLHRFDGSRLVPLRQADGLSSDYVNTLVPARDGGLWIGTDKGLDRLQRGVVSPVALPAEDRGSPVAALVEGSDGALWVGFGVRGVRRLRGSEVGSWTTAEGLPSDVVAVMAQDRHGSVWVGTDQGVARIAGGRVSTYGVEQGLPANVVSALLEDREGNVWIGTTGGGLVRLREGLFTPWSSREGLSNDLVFPILEDRDGSIWIGTESGGLNRLRDGRFEVFGARQGLPAPMVNALLQDRDGAVWAGTGGGGLARLDSGRFRVWRKVDGLADDHVNGLAQDSAGVLWIGTMGGLGRMQQDRFQSFRVAQGLADDVVWAVLAARDGSVWIGTERGLDHLVDGRFVPLRAKDGLGNDNVSALFEDDAGTLWVGTNGGGLSWVRDGRVVGTVDARRGLFDDLVLSVLDDGRGWLWMTSNKGVYRVEKAALERVARGEAQRVESIAYGTADGMRSAEFNGGFQPASLRTRAGRLWFPTVRGAVEVDPARTAEAAAHPTVVIEQVEVDGRTRAANGPLEIEPGTERLELRYTALALGTPERVRFRYRLDGFDHGWVDAGTRRTAYYTQVPAGRYTFHVTASADGATWSPAGASLVLRLKPRFHETPWFAALCALGLVAAAVGTHRFRLAEIRARERELVALVDLRTRGLQEAKERTEQALAQAEAQKSLAEEWLLLTEEARADAERLGEEAQRLRAVAEAATAEAEEASRVKSQFLASMSHELRTPLNAIIGYSEMIQEELADRDAQDLAADVGKVRSAGRHLLGLINDILDLSKIEAGKMELLVERFELKPLIDEVASTIKPLLDKNHNVLEVRGAESLGVVSSDVVRVKQILLNLLSNATKFTSDGRVTLTCARSTPGPEATISLSVSDTGIGMTPEQLGRLFQAFTQADASTTRKFGGTGLGLVISRRLCHMMGGEISVESTLGQGTTFRVDMPAEVAAILGSETTA